LGRDALHDFGVRHFDVERRFEPRDAARKSEVVKGRTRPFTSSAQQFICCPQPDAPPNGAASEQPSAATLTNQKPGERRRQAEDSANDKSAFAADPALDPASRRAAAIDASLTSADPVSYSIHSS